MKRYTLTNAKTKRARVKPQRVNTRKPLGPTVYHLALKFPSKDYFRTSIFIEEEAPKNGNKPPYFIGHLNQWLTFNILYYEQGKKQIVLVFLGLLSLLEPENL